MKTTLTNNSLTITVHDCSTIQVTSNIDTTNMIVIIKEYEVTINYPKVIFVPSPKEVSDFCWGTTYDNDFIVGSGQFILNKNLM